MFISCSDGGTGTKKSPTAQPLPGKSFQVRLITLDPGHFHAALVQKTMYDQVAPDVHVYAPEGPDCLQHLERIRLYNSRRDNPTSWNEIVFTGPDFLNRMLADKPGNVVILSGNNMKKAEYIERSVDAGLNVLADKPMVIKPGDFPKLVSSFRAAGEKGLILYDIMTERYEITTIIQKLLMQNEDIFGKLECGTRNDPSVVKSSVHYFSKMVSGVQLRRPDWFFDVTQQGEGIADVATHLVDLVQWECFPEQIIDTSDINVVYAKRWSSALSKDEFRSVTGLNDFPDYLRGDVSDGKLNVCSNGEMVYNIRGIWAKVSVTWDYMPPDGGGDTYNSFLHGSGCDLVIKQGAGDKFQPELYIENIRPGDRDNFGMRLKKALNSLPYDNLTAEPAGYDSFKIIIPEKYRVSHEEHFGQVTARFLEFIKEGKIPGWEVSGMIAKYFTTTHAMIMAGRK